MLARGVARDEDRDRIALKISRSRFSILEIAIFWAPMISSIFIEIEDREIIEIAILDILYPRSINACTMRMEERK